MELVMLGTGHAVVTEYYNTCFVLRERGRTLLVDGGGGAELLKQLKRAGIPWDSIDEIFVTHKHTDHILGIVWMMRLICAALGRGDARRVRIYSNEEVAATLRDLARLLLTERDCSFIGNGLDLVVVPDGEERNVIGHRTRFFDICSTKVSQMGFTMQLDGGGWLACCGDEPYHECCRNYVAGCDWLLHEAFCLHEQADVYRPYEKHHSTAADAARVAQELGVRNLVLYHTEDQTFGERKELYTREAKRHFDGGIFVPDDLEAIQVG
ncbi:MAG: MBL fold metallo-hydrolase [Eggerthellaceae bacterium]|nr:MBL fold metallo-hydrolase [Eggerthellaceae bacterium]